MSHYRCKRVRINRLSIQLHHPAREHFQWKFIVEITYKQFLLWSNNKLQCVTRKSKIITRSVSACSLLSQRRGSYLHQFPNWHRIKNIRTILYKIYCILSSNNDTSSTWLAQDRGQWRTLFVTVKNLRVLYNARNFFSVWATPDFSKMTQLRGVSQLFLRCSQP
jgi:hypothetical protein